jgi:hypothetical protein
MYGRFIIEEESGTSTGWIHPHNGYWAGDFWASDATDTRESAH